MLSSFPSPSSDMIPGIGVKYYGVMIALGVLAAVSVARRRWRAAGHDPDEVADIGVRDGDGEVAGEDRPVVPPLVASP